MALPQRKDERFSKPFSEAANDPRFKQQSRPTLAYSSTTSSSDGVRKVRRTSSMPGSPSNQSFNPTKPTVSDVFNERYDKSSIQPSSVDDPRPNNKSEQLHRSNETTRKKQVEYYQQPIQTPLRQGFTKKIPSLKKKAFTRTRVSAVTFSIYSWAFPFYLLQLVLAIINILALALAGMIDHLMSLVEYDPNDSTLISIAKITIHSAVDAASAAAGFVATILNVDISIFNPTHIYAATTLLLLSFGGLTLMTMYAIYKINRIEPIFGQSSGLKIGVLILCVFGYFTPILNLLPWFLFWTIVVWFRPK